MAEKQTDNFIESDGAPEQNEQADCFEQGCDLADVTPQQGQDALDDDTSAADSAPSYTVAPEQSLERACENSDEISYSDDSAVPELSSDEMADATENGVAAQENDFLPERSDGDDVSAREKKQDRFSKVMNVAIIVMIILLSATLLIRAFVFTRIVVKGQSMQYTYMEDDRVNVSKLTSPQRGDVVIFYANKIDSKFLAMFATSAQSDEGGKYEKYIKRVVALEGDKIWAVPTENPFEYYILIQTAQGDLLRENYYVHDGEMLPQSIFYIHDESTCGLGILRGTSQENPHIVAKDCFFAMGDNRDNSFDSRKKGDIPLAQLFGVVV